LAALAGSRVAGIAGTDEKCEWITDESGYDVAIDYKTENVPNALAEARLDGVDVYFHNVGGENTDAVFELLNTHSMVSVCGQIASYNGTDTPVGPRKFSTAVRKRIQIEGVLVSEFETRYGEAAERLSYWVQPVNWPIGRGLSRVPQITLGSNIWNNYRSCTRLPCFFETYPLQS
jgi:NADPH-dependent curcumin reductase CurA